jgi:autotransporter-associated beta strand protein
LLALAAPAALNAADVFKANNTKSLKSGKSWIGGAAPTSSDTAVFGDIFTQTGTLHTGDPLSYYGLHIAGGVVTSLIDIHNSTYANVVEILGGGIDMSSASRDLEIFSFHAGADQTWDVATGHTLTLGGGRFSGSGDVEITGGGTVEINADTGADAYSGTITVANGLLVLNALEGGDVEVKDGGILDTEIGLPGDLVLGSSTGATLVVDPNNQDVLKAADLTLHGTNTVQLTDVFCSPVELLAYSGTLSGDPTDFQLDPASAGSYRNAPTFQDTGGTITMEIADGELVKWTGAIDDQWDVNATVNWDLNGSPTTFFNLDSVLFDDSASVQDIVVSGKAAVGSMSFSNPTRPYTLSGATLNLKYGIRAAGDVTISNDFVLAGSQTSHTLHADAGATLEFHGFIDASSSVITIDGGGTVALVGDGTNDQILNGAGIVKNGSGVLAMSGRNTASGNVAVNAGTARFTSPGGNKPNFGGRLAIGAGAVVEADTGTFGSKGRDIDITDGALTLTGASLQIGTDTGTSTFDGATIGGVGQIRSRGVFHILGDSPTTFATEKWQVRADTTWRVEDVTGDAATDLAIAAPSGFTDRGDRTLVKTGAGTMALDGITNLNGDTLFRIDQGTLLLRADARSTDTADWQIASGATLQIGDGGTTGALGAGATVLSNDGAIVFDRSDDSHFPGVPAGGGTLVQQGAGTLFLDGNIGVSGTQSSYQKWHFNAGTVSVSGRPELHDGYIGGPDTIFTFDGGTLRFEGWGSGQNLGYNKGIRLSAGGGTLSVDPNVTVNINSSITGPGSLTKTGAGTLVINTNAGAGAQNTYTGPTSIVEGTLKIIDDGAIAFTPVIDVGPGATFDVAGTTDGIFEIGVGQTLKGTGTIVSSTANDEGLMIYGTHAPGNSPGVQTFNGIAWYKSGSQFDWELIGNTTSSRGTNYDGVNGGWLLGVAPSNTTFNIILDGSQNGGVSSVDFADTFWDTAQTWTVFDNFSFGTIGLFTNLNVVPPTGQTTSNYGSFSLSTTSSGIDLHWTPVPEPAAPALLGLLLAAGMTHRRRA